MMGWFSRKIIPKPPQQILEIAGGTTIGWDHMRDESNNQDAYFILHNSESTVAVVCDGCGSREHSEIGAKIGARMIAQAIGDQHLRLSSGANSEDALSIQSNPLFWERVRLDVVAEIRSLANRMSRSISEVISEYFLFSLVGMLLDQDATTFFAIGDGYFVINGDISSIGPFPGNSPPYLSYELVGSSVKDESPDLLKFQLLRTMNTADLETFMVATDGLKYLIDSQDQLVANLNQPVGSIGQFWTEDRYFKNPDLVRRRLVLINGGIPRVNAQTGDMVIRNGYLKDDTTIIVGRRRVDGGDS